MRRRSSALTSLSFACSLFRIVCLTTVNRPLLLFFPQICVKPRKLNVSGFPLPARRRFSAANGPNSSSRVFSGCSSKWEYVEGQPVVRLHVRDWRNGKSVVLIHGSPLSNAMYDYQMTELARKGYRAISISLRGYGKSDKPWGP